MSSVRQLEPGVKMKINQTLTQVYTLGDQALTPGIVTLLNRLATRTVKKVQMIAAVGRAKQQELNQIFISKLFFLSSQCTN